MVECKDCVHNKVCAEVNSLKCRKDFIWYDAKYGCPYYSADVVPKSEYDAVVSAVDNSTQEFLKLHDDYQEAKREVEMLQGALKAEERHNELTMEMAKKALDNAKAEVDREIFEEIEQKVKDEMELNNKAMVNCFHNEELRNRSSSRNTALREIYVFISALKNKYTEQKND